jgi:transposase
MPQLSPHDVGFDVHHASMAGASLAEAHGAAVPALGTLGTRPGDMDHRIRTRPAHAQPLVVGYEAGPWGCWRDGDLTHKGPGGWVVAPALMPQQAGDRIHTDRRDAVPRARLLRSGDRTPVAVPTVGAEALRDRPRAREEALWDLKSATVRLTAFRRRQDSRSTGQATWGPAPRRGRCAVVGATPAQQRVVQDYGGAVQEHPARLPRRAHARPDQGQTWRLPPVVEALHALRGVPCIGAVTLVAARGARTRGANPRHLRHSLGRIPSADARGERRRPGSSPKAGHPPARRTWVEGA